MKTVILAVLLIGVGYGVAVWMSGRRTEFETKIEKTGAQVTEGVRKVTDAVKESMNGDKLRKELDDTGKVVRKKAIELGERVADATADARTTAAVKAHLGQVAGMEALKISVSTTAGRVTLSGAVETAEKLSQVIRLALEVDGAREVVSTIQIIPARK